MSEEKTTMSHRAMRNALLLVAFFACVAGGPLVAIGALWSGSTGWVWIFVVAILIAGGLCVAAVDYSGDASPEPGDDETSDDVR